MCSTSQWRTMLNKHFQRQVNLLCVFCPHEDRGCGWQGELAAYAQHVMSCSMTAISNRKNIREWQNLLDALVSTGW